MIPKSCRLFGQDDAPKQGLSNQGRFTMKRSWSKRESERSRWSCADLGLTSMRSSTLAMMVGMAVVLGGCRYESVPDPQLSTRDSEWMAMIPSVEEERQFARYRVDDPTGEPPGT